jgi:HEAT repeat protein
MAAVNEREIVENPKLWHSVATIREWPDLESLGAAGARMLLDSLLSKPEGITPEDLAGLRDIDVDVLRSMATREDPTFGITHQARAIGALAERHDAGSALILAERARDGTEDDRIRIAAIHALGVIGAPGADGVVRDLAAGKPSSVRTQAIKALANLGSMSDVGMLEQIGAAGDEGGAAAAQRAIEVLQAKADRR